MSPGGSAVALVRLERERERIELRVRWQNEIECLVCWTTTRSFSLLILLLTFLVMKSKIVVAIDTGKAELSFAKNECESISGGILFGRFAKSTLLKDE